jgi:membrane protease YdiL (CAAX protease family)
MCVLHIYFMIPSFMTSLPASSPWLPTTAVTLVWHAPAVGLLLVAPVLEEVVFRAGLHEALLRRLPQRCAAGALRANVLTALVFAAVHLATRPGVLAALTLLPALLVGALYQRRRQLAPCIAVHAAFNAVWLTWSTAST